MPKSLIQIVAPYGAGARWIGDYSLLLLNNTRSLYGIETQFLACSTATSDSFLTENFVVRCLPAHSLPIWAWLSGKMSTGRDVSISSAFAPYGYSKRGSY